MPIGPEKRFSDTGNRQKPLSENKTYQAEYGLLRNSNTATVGVGCHQIVQ